MIGRDRELDEGVDFLESVRQGSACLVLEGAAGIGKTTVWRELVHGADVRGFRVLSCRAAAAEAKLSFAGLTDLLSSLDASVYSSLPAPQRDALEVALLQAVPGPRAPSQRAVFAGLCTVLFGLAAEDPLLLAVDDLQWLDRPSQAALEFALRRMTGRRIGFLCSVRTGAGPGFSSGLERALEESGAARVQIGPLSVGALHNLILERLGQALARPTVVKIAAAAEGNPFYALEIARELLRRSEPSALDALPAPDDLSELVARRIRRLPGATREQLMMVAALSSPVLAMLDREALEPAEEAGTDRDQRSVCCVLPSAVLDRDLRLGGERPPSRPPPPACAGGHRP